MTDQQLIDYYKEQNKPDPWWAMVVWPLALMVIVPLVIIMLIFMIIWVFIESIWNKITRKPDEPEYESVIDRYNKRGIKLLLGYDGKDDEASTIAQTVLQKYGNEAQIYDWSPIIGMDRAAISELPRNDSDVICLLEVDDDNRPGVYSQIEKADSPAKVYAVAITEDYYEFLTAFPLLDDWYKPTKVLDVASFYNRIDDYMQNGLTYGAEEEHA